ncbi:MAG TPA: AI-2E family transporter [Streptosporangiaceae bacterium]|jgi:predicted PurR-regulated permease PerM
MRLAAASQANDAQLGGRETETLVADRVEPETARLVVVEQTEPSVAVGVPRGIRVAAAWSWRFLVIAAAALVIFRVIAELSLVVIPVVVALLLAALLQPGVAWLRRRGVPRTLAAAIVLVTGIAAMAGTLTAVIQAFVEGLPDLVTQTRAGVETIRDWLVDGPLSLSQAQIDNGIESATKAVTENQDALTAGALSTATTVGHILTGFFLVLFTTFFFLKDGRGIWNFLLRFFPRSARAAVAGAAEYSWRTLIAYVRATVLVAFVDAVGIGLAVYFVGVPLALPLAALVFLGSFIPIIGATLSGTVAVLVALVAKGPVAALLVLAAVLAVQQLEGHVLQPLLLGRAVSLHPLGVIVALATGVVLAGIFGALVAVPLVAVANTAVRYLADYHRGKQMPPGDSAPPGGDAADGGRAAGEGAAEPRNEAIDSADSPPPPRRGNGRA